jgi:uncharacterized protein (TIGR00730 family)
MSQAIHPDHPLPSARTDADRAAAAPLTPQTASPSYRLAYTDDDFLLRQELRPVRMQLELLKPDLELSDRLVESTIVVFGSARVLDPQIARDLVNAAEQALAGAPGDPGLKAQHETARLSVERSRYYDMARSFGRLATEHGQAGGRRDFVIITGGGPGIMEAANRGAADAGGISVGLNIVLPREQAPNRYITPELCFRFHYFAMRKMHFLMRARALVVFPGGYGTLDELFEALCLLQTGKIAPIPVLLVGRDYWERLIDFEMLATEHMIDPRDLALFEFVDTAQAAWDRVAAHYSLARDLPPGPMAERPCAGSEPAA